MATDMSALDMRPADVPLDQKLPVLIVPGFHDRALTDGWVRSLPSYVEPFITDAIAVSPLAIYDWLKTTIETQLESRTDLTSPAPSVVVIAFSAGVVGAAGAAAVWNQTRAEQSVQSPLPIGGKVARLIAVDGWGVPVLGVPVTRISHDRFTHLSSLPLGAGDVNFYADPSVAHLDLWRSPEASQGRQVDRWALQPGDGIAMTAAEFLQRQLYAEWNQAFNWRYSG